MYRQVFILNVPSLSGSGNTSRQRSFHTRCCQNLPSSHRTGKTFLLILTGTDQAPSTNARCGMPFRNSGQLVNLTWLKQRSHLPTVITFLRRSLVCFKRNMVKIFALITKARLILLEMQLATDLPVVVRPSALILTVSCAHASW